MARDRAAERFEDFLNSIELKSGKALPWGKWRRYLKANPDLAERLTTTQEKAAHRQWCVRALRSRNLHGGLPDAVVRKKLTRDSGCGKGGAVWNDQRRRRRGLQGRPQKAAVVRGLLFEWFSVLGTALPCASPRNS